MSRMLSVHDRKLISRTPVARKPREIRLGSKVYFILCQATGRVKVGVASDPYGRLANLQVGSPTVLKLIAEIEGDGLKEKLIHQRLAQWRIRGEWFHYADEVVEIIVDEVTAHLKNLHRGLYSERAKLDNYLQPQSAVIHQYRPSEKDVLLFLSDCTIRVPGERTQSSKLYQAFEAWCQLSGSRVCTQKAFTMAMANAGYERFTSNFVFFLDIQLKSKGSEDRVPSADVA